MSTSLLVLAQAAAGPSMGMNALFIIALFAIMYFVMIRPQQKQAKEQAAMLSALKKGDDVVTQGGILGKVWLVADKTVTVEIASGVKMRVLKSSIQGKVTVGDEPAKVKEGDEKKEEK